MKFDRLGPYRIGRRLGKGGMGSVFEAVHEETGQRVAVKALSPQLASAEGFRDRFEAEIDSLKKLQHPGIVRLYGWGEDAGALFYSMELVDGPSLEEEIAQGRRFDWQETLHIAVQICRALKHAHDHGVIHRDVKPANVLVAGDGVVKIADFGIARLFGSSQLTMAGGVLGTADYMSPEQADGGAVTDKCDQYCLGCVMFALLAGRPPFRARSMPEMLQMQRFAEPDPVRHYAPNAPEQLEKLIQQLLSKDPDDRFPNVLVLARHMEAMEKALLRRAEREASEQQFDTVAGPAEVAGTAAPGLDATREYERPNIQPLETSDSNVQDAPTLAESELSEDDSVPPERPADEPAPRPARFTTVDDDAQLSRSPPTRERWSFVAQLAGLAAALACLVYLGWRLTRPATADEIYAQIQAVVEQQGVAGLPEVAGQLDEFLARFPDDDRSEGLGELREELELVRLEKQLRLKSRFAGDELASPVALAYAEAIRVVEVNPARAIQLLQSLLDLYQFNPESASARASDDAVSDDGASADDRRKWLTLAERQLTKLRASADQQAEELLPELNQRLAVARRLEQSDRSQALRMYNALVQLYADQPWARPAVDEAKHRAALLSHHE